MKSLHQLGYKELDNNKVHLHFEEKSQQRRWGFEKIETLEKVYQDKKIHLFQA